jgi:hypothetical protein
MVLLSSSLTSFLELVIFSAEFSYKSTLIKKLKIYMLTNKKLYILGRTHRRKEQDHKITELYGITVQVMPKGTKHILHFKNKPDRQVKCEL